MSSPRRSTSLVKQCRPILPYPRRYSLLPQQTDLLERYQALVCSGRVTRDDEQIQVVMALRRLQKNLEGYAPQQHASTLLRMSHSKADSSGVTSESPWWVASKGDLEQASRPGSDALVRLKSTMEELASLDTPKGLILTGSPGSGKSFLIDLWFSGMPTPFKARKHYNQLVLEMYRGVWEETQLRMASAQAFRDSTRQAPVEVAWGKNLKKQLQALVSKGSLPIKWNSRHLSDVYGYTPTIAFAVAQRLVQRHWLLVFDEIQLLDVSSATLLADVLSWFWRMGGVIVGTSNKVPDDLYKNGVQRERLQPFVEALKIRSPVHTMKSETDWREVASEGASSSWYTVEQQEAFQGHSDTLLQEPVANRALQIFGRTLRIPLSTQNVCAFTFAELCEESLGSADYISLASTYSTLILTDIPILPVSSKNEARRFISLIDALYEARCRLVCIAAAQPQALFFPDAEEMVKIGGGGGQHEDVMMAESVSEMHGGRYRPNISSYDSPGMKQAARAPAVLAMDKLSIFSGQEEQFAFKRALSRLLEMTSPLYAQNEVWAPSPEAARQWELVATRTAPIGNVPRPLKEAGLKPTDTTAVEADIKTQPAAPKLRPEHVWGVREDWGPRTGNWGKGAKAYQSNAERPS